MKQQDEILRLWLSQDEKPRTSAEAEKLADHTWEQGPRLARHPATHYQQVMAVLRSTFEVER